MAFYIILSCRSGLETAKAGISGKVRELLCVVCIVRSHFDSEIVPLEAGAAALEAPGDMAHRFVCVAVSRES